MAARMSTASSPSRKTMIAALVTTVARLAAVAERGGGVVELVVEHEPRLVHLAPRRVVGDQLGEPRLPAAPNQTRPSMSMASPGSNDFSRRSGPNSKNA